ncbi:unnamed protein product [Linum trigynum]|uniref:Uncharacterized protein n=1 Tax=Linum trigynum TaxID=586398 RepID=A0AAV2F3U2_9ROSI
MRIFPHKLDMGIAEQRGKSASGTERGCKEVGLIIRKAMRSTGRCEGRQKDGGGRKSYLNEIDSTSAGGSAPKGQGLDLGGLETNLGG